MAKLSSLLAAALMAAPLLTGCLAAGPGAAAARLPGPSYDPPVAAPSETAVLSGGCFWGVQGVFEHVKGVKRVLAGYAGGHQATAQYELVSTGTTGHAESVKITFVPSKVCSWDLKVKYHDGEEAVWESIDLCSVEKISIFYKNKTTSATFD